MASKLVTEVLGVYDVNPEFQNKFLLNDSISRLVELDSMFPQSRKPTKDVTAAMFDYFCELKQYAKDIAERQGIDTSATITIGGEKIPVYDFSCITYDQFHNDAADIVGYIDATYTDPFKTFPGLRGGFDQPRDWKYYVGKILGLLGLKDIWQAGLEILEGEVPALMTALGEAAAARNWSALRELFALLFDFLLSLRFFNALKAKIGEVAARKIIGKLAAKFVPLLGWAVLIGQLIWGLAEEFL